MLTAHDTNLSFSTIQDLLRSNKITCVDLVKFYLSQIEEKKDLNAFLEVFEDEALSRAEEIDAKLKAGTAGQLAGMVMGIKDMISIKGHTLSASSKMLGNFKAIYNATVVERLLAEDVIIIGRLNCDEFAMGGSNEKSAYGAVLNPVNKAYVAGGSSGGSACAVAANLCTATLGTDTGGSIRQPSAFCGVVGIKPTYGRVSRYGCIAFASSFDQVGPIANTIDDCALILEVMSGVDAHDNTTSSELVPQFSKSNTEKTSYTIAYLDCLDHDGVEPELKIQIQATLDQLKAQGHTIKAIDFPLLDSLIPTYYVLTTAEASSNLARYDGVHYGYRSPNAVDLESTYKLSRSEGFGPEVKRRIMLGTFVLSAGFYDAYYIKAQRVRRLILDATQAILKDADVILTPTTPSTAFQLGAKSKDPLAMYLEDIFTVHANLTGCPAISLPLYQHSNGLPMGLQLMGNTFKEEILFDLSRQLLHT